MLQHQGAALSYVYIFIIEGILSTAMNTWLAIMEKSEGKSLKSMNWMNLHMNHSILDPGK